MVYDIDHPLVRHTLAPLYRIKTHDPVSKCLTRNVNIQPSNNTTAAVAVLNGRGGAMEPPDGAAPAARFSTVFRA
jgi:hypothetical protein